MKVSVKSFDVEMDVKTKGIELDIYDSYGNHRGDLIINKKHLIWCKGKTTREKGKKITLEKFIEDMEAPDEK